MRNGDKREVQGALLAAVGDPEIRARSKPGLTSQHSLLQGSYMRTTWTRDAHIAYNVQAAGISGTA